MILGDISNYRIPGLLSIVLINDEDPGRLIYGVYTEDYDTLLDDDKDPSNEYFEYHAKRLINYLKIKRKLNRFDLDYNLILDYAYTYGGVHINCETGGWKSFYPLETTRVGIDYGVQDQRYG